MRIGIMCPFHSTDLTKLAILLDNNHDWDWTRAQYLSLLLPVQQSAAAVEHNDVIIINQKRHIDWITLLVSCLFASGLFHKASKLCKASEDAYNRRAGLNLKEILNERVAEGVTFDLHDFTAWHRYHCTILKSSCQQFSKPPNRCHHPIIYEQGRKEKER